jgi:polar amino acid transport system substrate-binding protein
MLFACVPKTPVLKVGLTADFPPFEYYQNNVLTGFDVDLAREIGTRLGYKISFQELEFDELLPALRNGKIDLAISGMTINKQRSELVDFSIPYFSADQVMLTRNDFEVDIKQDSDLADFTIGAQNGTTGQYFLQYNLMESGKLDWNKLKAYKNNNQALSALFNKEIDLVIMDDSAAKAFTHIKPVKICYMIHTEDEYGIAMNKNSPLKESVDQALSEIMKSSIWTQMITTYMSE